MIVIGAALLYVVTARPVDRRDLAVGDCLYVPTNAAKDPTTIRPIGESGRVDGGWMDHPARGSGE